jgi:hypothetical protein
MHLEVWITSLVLYHLLSMFYHLVKNLQAYQHEKILYLTLEKLLPYLTPKLKSSLPVTFSYFVPDLTLT